MSFKIKDSVLAHFEAMYAQKESRIKFLNIKDIRLIPEFENLMKMEESVVKAITESMINDGFKKGHECHVWKRSNEYILIDGHTRRHCAIKAGLKTLPCVVHNFKTIYEAKKYAIKEQVDRRNLSGEALLQAVASFDFSKGKGNSDGEKGKASEIIAKQIGVSSKTVEKARVVIRESSPEQKEAIRNEGLSVNQVYNQIRSTKAPEDEKYKINKRDNVFIDGIHYALSQVYTGMSPKDVYLKTIHNTDITEMKAAIKDIDLSKMFSIVTE